jgi:hypothetical protein
MPLARRLPLERPDPAAAEIAVEVEPPELREALAAVDLSAGERTAEKVAVFGDGLGELGRIAGPPWWIAVATFNAVPTVVLAT